MASRESSGELFVAVRRHLRVASVWTLLFALALVSGGGCTGSSAKPSNAQSTGSMNVAAGSGGNGIPNAPVTTGATTAMQQTGGAMTGGVVISDTGGAVQGSGGATGGSVDISDASTTFGGYPLLEAGQIGAPVMISDAFMLAESPLWDPCNHQLLFTDVTASTINALGADGQISVYASNTNNANGIAWDIDGSLILAQMGGSPGHIARMDSSKNIQTLEPAGSPTLHTPDDTIVRSDGTIYFTDGDFYPIGNILGFSSVLPIYMLKPGGASLVNVGSVSGPNGIEFSPDEKTLYVSAYGGGTVASFAVAADGSLTPGSAAASGLTHPDSLCLDAAGNLYVGVSTGLQVLRPDGAPITLIPISSSSGTTSCGFGGDDGKTLYISAWTTLWKVEGMPIPGQDWLVNRDRLGCN